MKVRLLKRLRKKTEKDVGVYYTANNYNYDILVNCRRGSWAGIKDVAIAICKEG